MVFDVGCVDFVEVFEDLCFVVFDLSCVVGSLCFVEGV